MRENADQIWRNKRYGLMIEYSERQSAVPPFSLIPHTVIFFKWLFSLCCGCVKKPTNSNGLKTRCTPKEKEELIDFENVCVAQILWREKGVDGRTVDDVCVQLEEVKEELRTLKRVQGEMALRNGGAQSPPPGVWL